MIEGGRPVSEVILRIREEEILPYHKKIFFYHLLYCSKSADLVGNLFCYEHK